MAYGYRTGRKAPSRKTSYRRGGGGYRSARPARSGRSGNRGGARASRGQTVRLVVETVAASEVSRPTAYYKPINPALVDTGPARTRKARL